MNRNIAKVEYQVDIIDMVKRMSAMKYAYLESIWFSSQFSCFIVKIKTLHTDLDIS